MSEAWQLHRATIPVGPEVHVLEIFSLLPRSLRPDPILAHLYKIQKAIFFLYRNKDAQRRGQAAVDQVSSILIDLSKIKSATS